jgi:predicted DNA-binding protein
MSNTLTVRLPKELLERLRQVARRTGLPAGLVVRDSLENTLAQAESNPLLKYAGTIKGGPKNLSSRKGFSGQ